MARTFPKILYITESCPDRIGTGSELRSFHVLEALKDVGDVEVVLIEPQGVARTGGCLNGANVLRVPLESRPKRTILQKLYSLANPHSFYPHGCGIAQSAVRPVLDAANAADVVWFFKLRTPNLIAVPSWPHSVVDIDDIPSAYERTTLARSNRFFERVLTLGRYYRLRRREMVLGRRFSVLTVCSDYDKGDLLDMGVSAPIFVIPNGFEAPGADYVRKSVAPARIGFTGLFEYEPNVEAIRWFTNHCWPAIKKEQPGIRLRLAGRGSEFLNLQHDEQIDSLGWVNDLDAEIATWSLMIVPIFSGAGTRVKIPFAFSRKCPVVSTTLGAFGYHVRQGEELFLADNPADFINACIMLIVEPNRAISMVERAYARFLANWTWEAIAPRVGPVIEKCLKQSYVKVKA